MTAVSSWVVTATNTIRGSRASRCPETCRWLNIDSAHVDGGRQERDAAVVPGNLLSPGSVVATAYPFSVTKVLKVAGPVVLVVGTLILLALGYIADVVGAATALFSAGFEEWLRSHAVWVFWTAVVAILILAACIIVQGRSRANFKTELKDTSRKLADTKSQLAEARAEPSERDVEVFADLYKVFPPDGKTIDYLTQWFSGMNWEWEKLDEVQEFFHGWSINKRFFDAEMQVRLEDLRQHCAAFLGEIAIRTFKDDRDERITTLKSDQFKDEQGHEDLRAYERYGKHLQGLGDEVVVAHGRLIDAGLKKRLYRSSNHP